MPKGYEVIDARTVRDQDGRKHDALEAIEALPWTAQLCPFMRHEYSIRGKGPEWAWDVLASLLLAKNPETFRAYFRGYPSANRYWDAPDGHRYWRGNMLEIDRGEPDDAGLRRVAAGAKPAEQWAGPPHAPDGIGLYEQDEKNHWWPTEAALAAGFQPCRSCELTNKKAPIVRTPNDPGRIAKVIARADEESRIAHGRPITRDQLAQLLRSYPDRVLGPSEAIKDEFVEADHIPPGPAVSTPGVGLKDGGVAKLRVVRRLLELRAREAPLGSSGYRGVLTQKAIADVADVPVREVTRAAIALDRELRTSKTTGE